MAIAMVGGCNQDSAPDPGNDQAGMELNHTSPGSPEWQPFTKDSAWNLALPAQRQEVPLPVNGLLIAPMSVSDGEYGIKVYFASPTDPLWQITFDDYNSSPDNWSPDSPAAVRAPAVMLPPTGSDGTVIVVDENRHFAYECWRFTAAPATTGTASPRAHCASLNLSDLRSSGIHRNVGVTAAGLPGVGGVLRSWELQSGEPIRHKLWLAVHPDLLLAAAVWPANQFDVKSAGKHAALRYGDVVALSQSYDLQHGECDLSPVLARLAQGLQDFGGIVQDSGGDSIGVVAEVGSLTSHLDVDSTTMWAKLLCLRKYLVRVDAPWTGAQPGGLGY